MDSLSNIFLKITASTNLNETQIEMQNLTDSAGALQQSYAGVDAQSKKSDASQRKLSQTINSETKSITALNNRVKLSAMSMNSLRERSRRLSEALDATSKSMHPERYKQLQKNLEQTERAMRKMQKASADQRLTSMVAMKAAAGWAAAVFALRAALRDAFNTIVEFDKKNAELASILGTTQDGVKALTDDAKRLGATTSYTASQMTELQIELAKLGFTTSEILNSTEAIQRFATATGADLAGAASLAGAALRSFSLDAKEMERVVSVMGVATTKSALSYSYLNTAMSTIAPTAKAFGFSIEETTALLGTLANSGFDASSAATATRNILLNLADANGKLAKALGQPIKSLDDLVPAIKKLKDRGVDLNTTLELTDKRSVSAFNTFLDGADAAAKLKDEITGVSEELKKMEETRLTSVAGKIDLMKSAWSGLVLAFEDSKGIFADVFSIITSGLNKITDLVENDTFSNWLKKSFGSDAVKQSVKDQEMIKKNEKETSEMLVEFQKKSFEEATWWRANYNDEQERLQEELKQKIANAQTVVEKNSVRHWNYLIALSKDRQKKINSAYQGMIPATDGSSGSGGSTGAPDADKAKAALKLKKEQLAQIRKLEVDMMKEGQEKDLAALKNEYDTQLEAVKGKTKTANDLRKKLEEKYLHDVEELNKKWDKKREKESRDIKIAELHADIQYAQQEVEALYGVESQEARKDALENLYALKMDELKRQSQAEIAELEGTEEFKAARQLEIEAKLSADIEELRKEQAGKISNIDSEYISALEANVKKAEDAIGVGSIGSRLSAIQARYDAEIALYDAQEKELGKKYQQGEITYADYQNQLFDLSRNRIKSETDLEKEKLQEVSNTFNEVVDQINKAASIAFDAIGASIQAQMDNLEEMYTTDAEEAKKNAKKKLITEEEYNKKKAELELKQQRLNKANAIFEIAMNTASAIMGFLANPGGYAGIALAATAGVMGTVQAGIAAAKPLPQYAKGRNGGPGEYALVGEKGPELMYVPQGASIVPNNKLQRPDDWGAYGVPQISIPDRPNVKQSLMEVIAMHQMYQAFDYDKLGKAVASNMPNQQQVYVNVDRSGVVVADGHDTHTYLNTKYCGSWS